MDLDELVKYYGQKTGLNNLRLNQDGLCRLVFDGKVIVDIEKTKNNFVFHGVVGKLPQYENEDFYMMLLEANGPENEVGNTFLGVDRKMNEILLFQNFKDQDVTYDYFDACMENFIAQVGKWKARLESGVVPESTEESAPARRETMETLPPGMLPPGMIRP